MDAKIWLLQLYKSLCPSVGLSIRNDRVEKSSKFSQAIWKHKATSSAHLHSLICLCVEGVVDEPRQAEVAKRVTKNVGGGGFPLAYSSFLVCFFSTLTSGVGCPCKRAMVLVDFWMFVDGAIL